VGRVIDFLPLGYIQFLVLPIGPTYALHSVQTPNQARTRFFRFCGVFAVNRENGLVIHHTFEDQFSREKVLRQEL
jgi:hypothetical protein